MSYHPSLSLLRPLPPEQDLTVAPRHSRGALAVAIIAWVLVPLVIVVPQLFGVKASSLTRDPSMLAGQPVYFGMLSNFGILAWCVATTAAWLGAALVGHLPRSVRRFLMGSGALSAFMLLDDLFLWHEHGGPHYLHIPEEAFYAGYCLFGLTLAIVFWRVILEATPYRLLLLAAAAFGCSVLMDLQVLPGGIATEDHCKLIGGIALAHYYVATVRRALVGWELVEECSQAGTQPAARTPVRGAQERRAQRMPAPAYLSAKKKASPAEAGEA